MNEIGVLFVYLNPPTLVSIIADLYWNDGFDIASKETYACKAVGALVSRVNKEVATALLAAEDINITDFPHWGGVIP